jgi:predicted membrane channel-forming protein YqfA (hemolysin III family)
METIGYWLGALLLLVISIVVIRRVDTPRRWRSIFIPIFLLGAVLVTLIGTMAAGTASALVLTVPAGLILFSIGLLGLVYHWKITQGLLHYRDRILDERREVQEQFDQNRYLSWARRLSDWFGPEH